MNYRLYGKFIYNWMSNMLPPFNDNDAMICVNYEGRYEIVPR